MARAVAAAVKMICKDRHDSFAAEMESFAFDDMQAFEDSIFIEQSSTKEWLRNLRQASRPSSSPSSNKSKKGPRSRAADFGDENRPIDANVDRKEAMKMATAKPLLAVPELSPRLSDVATARFKRNSIQQSSRHCTITSMCKQGQSVVLPGSPRNISMDLRS